MSNEYFIDWCIGKHRDTNHQYDLYLPYEFHLRMVYQVGKDFKHLLSNELWLECRKALYGHDLIEDTRCSYNDTFKVLGEIAANIIYAVTNEKGKNRKERANSKYYEGIVNTPGAVFVKLCDRIANVQYGKMTKSNMFEMYRKENENFINSLGYSETHELAPMFNYLIELFETK